MTPTPGRGLSGEALCIEVTRAGRERAGASKNVEDAFKVHPGSGKTGWYSEDAWMAPDGLSHAAKSGAPLTATRKSA